MASRTQGTFFEWESRARGARGDGGESDGDDGDDEDGSGVMVGHCVDGTVFRIKQIFAGCGVVQGFWLPDDQAT